MQRDCRCADACRRGERGRRSSPQRDLSSWDYESLRRSRRILRECRGVPVALSIAGNRAGRGLPTSLAPSSSRLTRTS